VTQLMRHGESVVYGLDILLVATDHLRSAGDDPGDEGGADAGRPGGGGAAFYLRGSASW